MNRFFSVAVVTALALGSFAACAAENAEERSELRQRADAFLAERARNPDFQPGEGRLTPRQRAEPLPKAQKARARRAAKTHAKRPPAETRRAKAAKRVRSLKKIPGAFVRK